MAYLGPSDGDVHMSFMNLAMGALIIAHVAWLSRYDISQSDSERWFIAEVRFQAPPYARVADHCSFQRTHSPARTRLFLRTHSTRIAC